MIVLSDNDLVLKLAQCDLLDEVGSLLGFDVADIYVTATARYQLLKKTREKGIASCGSEASYDRLKSFLDCANELPVVQDVELLMRLADVPGIDSGEQQLFAAMVEQDASFLLTDDKTSLTSLLDNADTFMTVVAAVSGRVVTFASVLLLALRYFGFPALKQKLLGNPRPDGMLRLVLSKDMTEVSLVACLCSYARPVVQLLACADRLPAEYLYTCRSELVVSHREVDG